jgi:hypothetical protein
VQIKINKKQYTLLKKNFGFFSDFHLFLSLPNQALKIMFGFLSWDALRIARFGDANSLMVSPATQFLHLAVQVTSGG